MQITKSLLCLALTLCIAATGVAQDEKKTKAKDKAVKSTTAQMMKAFEKAKLTDEQKGKATAIIEKHIDSLMEARKAQDAMLSKEQRQKRAAAVKKLKEEGVKGNQLWAKAMESVGLSEEEQKKYDEAKKKVGEVTAKMRMAITGLLTDEQKAALPKKGKGGKGKGKGKKKSDGDAKPKGGTQSVSLKLPGMT